MYQTEYCQVEYLKDMDAVLCSWKKFCQGDDYRNPLRYGLKLLKEKKCRNWITDTTNGFENKEEDTVWLLNEFLPGVIDSPCDNLFFIMGADSPLKYEIEGQTEALQKFFNVHVCTNINEIQTKLFKT